MYLASDSRSDAIEIEIDYSLDTNGFFNQTGSKEALRAVCDYFETILTDDLARIDPSEWTGETWTALLTNPATGDEASFPGKVVPADTIIIYAGGRALGGPAGRGGPGYYSAGGTGGDALAWFDLLKSRGEARALQFPARDFASWGGGVAFTTSLTWNFSLTSASGGDTSFVSIALHELGHVFGVGTADSWDDYIVGGHFTGPESVASFGGDVPVSTDGAHWQNDGKCELPNGYVIGNPLNVLSKTIAQFGTPAGLDQIALMDPSSCRVGSQHLVFTELDVAGLADIGWEIPAAPPVPIIPPALAVSYNQANTSVTLSWTADPAFTYQLLEAPALSGWADIGPLVSGQSGMVSYIDMSPPAGKNFYRLEVDHAPAPSPPPAAFASTPAQWGGEVIHVETLPRFATGCSVCSH